MASPGNQHCANSIGTLLFPILKQFSVHCVKSVKTLNSRREQWLWRAGGSDLIRALLLLNFLLEDYHSERSAGEQRAVARVTKHEWEQKRKWDDRIRRCTTNDNSPQQLRFSYEKIVLPSVLWRCWLGGRKGIRPVKNSGGDCWCGCLSGAICRLAYGPVDATATHCHLLQ